MVAITHPAALPIRRSHPLSVYRRRRLALAGALLVALALASVLLDALAGARSGDDRPRPVAEVAVVVEPGDTVWSIAAEVAPGADPRPVVDAIAEANGGSALVAGQRLVLALP